MLEFRIANGCGPTGRMLQELVGHTRHTGVVCWGVGQMNVGAAQRILNANASRYNKLQQLQTLSHGGVRTVPFYDALPRQPEHYPLLGRDFHHHGGRDIRMLLQPDDQNLPGMRADFYTRYVPRNTEYRVWVYRRRHLCTYEKRLERPERHRRIGANWRNGFAFRLVPSERVPEALRDLGARAVDLLGLDFGAVDVLLGVDNNLYVLEVNTAPGAEDGERFCLQQLAAKIRRWVELGCPRRNGDNNG